MADNNDFIKADMIERINSGGAWFRTRENNYLKIARSDTDASMYALACAVKRAGDGGASGSEGAVNCDAGAYSFGTDWFDISFHGKLIDIYVDPDTLQRWDIVFGEELQLRSEDGRLENASKLALFCKQADSEIREAMESGTALKAFQIDGAGFAQELEPSEPKMGRRKSIFSLVDISELKK